MENVTSKIALRVLCWATAALGSLIIAFGVWGVFEPHPNQGFEVAVLLLKIGAAATVSAFMGLLILEGVTGLVFRVLGKATLVAATTAVLGALVIAILACIIGAASGSAASGLAFVLHFLPALLAFSFVAVLAALVLFGVPTMLLLRKAEAETAFSYRIAGAGAGAAIGLLLGWGEPDVPGLVALAGCAYGVTAADLFFRFFRTGHPVA